MDGDEPQSHHWAIPSMYSWKAAKNWRRRYTDAISGQYLVQRMSISVWPRLILKCVILKRHVRFMWLHQKGYCSMVKNGILRRGIQGWYRGDTSKLSGNPGHDAAAVALGAKVAQGVHNDLVPIRLNHQTNMDHWCFWWALQWSYLYVYGILLIFSLVCIVFENESLYITLLLYPLHFFFILYILVCIIAKNNKNLCFALKFSIFLSSLIYYFFN